jgi:TrmH family RNA methyltransferase
MSAAAGAGVAPTLVTDRVLASLAETQHPQGIVAVVAMPRHDLGGLLSTRPQLLAVLAGVSDPGNAGTVIRTADAAGADGVILTTGSVDPYGGKCVRATAGSIVHLPVVTGIDLRVAVPAIRSAGLSVLATTVDGDSLDDVESTLAGPTAWLFGGEAHGLSPDEVAAADRAVRVPIHGRAESLNLAAAAAVCLYASARCQRRGRHAG